MTERNGVIEPDEQRRLSGFNPDFPTDAALDNLVADRYRLMSHMERDELVREMADAISTLRERITALTERSKLDPLSHAWKSGYAQAVEERTAEVAALKSGMAAAEAEIDGSLTRSIVSRG